MSPAYASAFDLGARHATWILAYLAGVLTVVVTVAVWVVAIVLVVRAAWQLAQPRIDIIRNR